MRSRDCAASRTIIRPNVLKVLHSNDLHGHLPQKVAALRPLREEADVYFDTGDLIRTGNLGIPLGPDPAWPLLAELRCDASTLGNRETHPLEAAFRMKLAGAAHPILCANAFRPDGSLAFPGTLEFERAGVKIGVVAGMVPMATERMKTRTAWSLRWTAPIPAIAAAAQEIRPRVDVLLALTHIGFRHDEALAQICPELDFILGGHSHTVLAEPKDVGGVWIAQGGSHGRYTGLYEWDGRRLRGDIRSLGG
ncbi:hypothetical protein EON81_14405 [bacterium]|nr:MAG: hypothetical protein EON81_14405 [bacterium]